VKKTTNKNTKLGEQIPVIAELSINGKMFTFSGNTVEEAISNINIKNYTKISRAILTIKNGDKIKSRLMNYVMMHRLLNLNGFTKDLAIKNITSLFI
jgi:hypothetical protein